MPMAVMVMVTGGVRQHPHVRPMVLPDRTDLPTDLQHPRALPMGLPDRTDHQHPRDLRTHLLHRTGHPVPGAVVAVLAEAEVMAVVAGAAGE